MPPAPRFKINRTTVPGEYMGEVFVGEECVMKRRIRARDNMKAMSRLQGMYQTETLYESTRNNDAQ